MSKLIDLTNQKFGRLTVLERDKNRKTTGGSYWICQCECGTIKSVKSISLRNGDISSCGCYRQEQLRKAKYQKSEEEMLNKRFGKLVVKQRSEHKGNGGELYWICQCDCGKTIEVRGHELRRKDENRTISCGCYHRSIGATNIMDCLIFNGIEFIDEYVFPDLPKSRFDFAIVEKGKIVRLIEFDGEQHYKDVEQWGGLELQQKRDKAKNEYALSNNIPLVRVPYWERDKITLEMLMGSTYEVREAG
jgi:hypothetical protein